MKAEGTKRGPRGGGQRTAASGRKPQVRRCAAPPQGVLLYTKEQMAALLQVSMRCLHEMMANGQISYLKIGGKLVRFRASHVLRRLKETSLVCHGEAEDGGQRPEVSNH